MGKLSLTDFGLLSRRRRRRHDKGVDEVNAMTQAYHETEAGKQARREF